MYGLAGVRIETDRPNEWVSLQGSGPVLQIWYLQQQGAGSLELTDADQVVDTITTNGDLRPGYYEREVAPGPHDYKLRTMDRLPVRLFGWVTGNREGVTYEMLGVNGAQASIILGWDEHMLVEQIRRRDPGLIVLAYGTNEASNKAVTVEGYAGLLLSVIGRVREAAPQASILLVGPPDRASRQRRKWVAYSPVERVVAAERAAATQTGCAFYDLRGKMGGTGAMHRWAVAGLAQTDHVHLTGVGYRLIAEALYSDVLMQFEAFLRAHEEK
jgi:lysophospholipase L1-like esterase